MTCSAVAPALVSGVPACDAPELHASGSYAFALTAINGCSQPRPERVSTATANPRATDHAVGDRRGRTCAAQFLRSRPAAPQTLASPDTSACAPAGTHARWDGRTSDSAASNTACGRQEAKPVRRPPAAAILIDSECGEMAAAVIVHNRGVGISRIAAGTDRRGRRAGVATRSFGGAVQGALVPPSHQSDVTHYRLSGSGQFEMSSRPARLRRG